jgi:hypothetical protein
MKEYKTIPDNTMLIVTLSMILICVLIMFFCALTHRTQSSLTKHNVQPTTTHDTLHITDTTTHTTVHNYFYNKAIYTTVPSGKIDTVYILKEYYTKRFVSDTINDSLLHVVINDTVYNNAIQHRKFSYKLTKPIQTIITNTVTNTIVASNKLHAYYGLGIIANKHYLGIAPEVSLQDKNKRIYTLGYDFINRNYTARIAIKI